MTGDGTAPDGPPPGYLEEFAFLPPDPGDDSDDCEAFFMLAWKTRRRPRTGWLVVYRPLSGRATFRTVYGVDDIEPDEILVGRWHPGDADIHVTSGAEWYDVVRRRLGLPGAVALRGMLDRLAVLVRRDPAGVGGRGGRVRRPRRNPSRPHRRRR